MPALSIAHLSDLHLSTLYRRENTRTTQRLLDYVGGLNVDHVVVTGDITADAEESDFALARSLFDAAGLLDPRKLSVVIGNHDVYGGAHTADDVLTFPRRCRTTPVADRVLMFTAAFSEAFERTVTNARVFPFGKVVGELLLAGINSVAPYSGIKNPIGSNGRVDDTQLKGLESLLASSLFRMHRKVVLIHHHFSRPEGIATGAVHTIWESIERQTMKLRGKKRLLQIFKKGRVELVLHGHLHRNEVYERGAIRMQNAGGSVMGQREMGQCYILQVFPDGIESRLHRVPAGEVAKVSSPVFQPLMPSVHVAA